MIGFLKKKLILHSCYFTIAAVMNYHKVSTSKQPLFIFLFYISVWASLDYTQGVHRPYFPPGGSVKESGAFLHQRFNCLPNLASCWCQVEVSFLFCSLTVGSRRCWNGLETTPNLHVGAVFLHLLVSIRGMTPSAPLFSPFHPYILNQCFLKNPFDYVASHCLVCDFDHINKVPFIIVK